MPAHRSLVRIAAPVGRLAIRLSAAARDRAERRAALVHLDALDDRTLADIGVSRDAIRRAYAAGRLPDVLSRPAPSEDTGC